MSHDSDPTDDLLIRARRDQLRDGEERRLRQALATSSETRLLFEAGCAFDGEAPVLPGDDARIEAMLRAVQKRRPKPRAAVPARRVWQALATGLLCGGAAVAAIEASESLLWPAPQPAVSALSTRALPAALGAPEAPVQSAPARAADSNGSEPPHASPTSLAPSVVEQRAVAPAAVSPRPSLATPVSKAELSPAAEGGTSARFADASHADTQPATAHELFAAANLARMQADSARAIATYLSLESDFPNSAEALSARLSLGMLYLRARQADLALEQFRAYRSLGRGPTLGEALWGESQALRQLGQRAQESRVLRELLEGFPESAYAAAAQKRLSEP